MSGPNVAALAALQQALYYLDRSFAPSQKTRAFSNAAKTVAATPSDELERLVAADDVTSLAGIGSSTGAVITDAILGRTGGYLDALEAKTRLDPGAGASIRAALRGDCHAHSTWSDGGAPIELMARTARALGHDYLVMTDHSPRLTIAHGLSPERLMEQRLEIERLNAVFADEAERGATPFRLLRGNEVDILEDGTLDLDDDILAGLDIVVASVHSKLKMPEPEMTARMVAAVSNPHVDILGHCTGRQVVGTPRAQSAFDPAAVFAACAENNTAVEINCRPERQDPPDHLLRIALDEGCSVAIDTDAHAPGQLEWQVSGCIKAHDHNIALDRIINTRTADELLAWSAG